MRFAANSRSLALPDSEHLGAASWALTLGSGPLVLERDGLGILHLLLGTALDTVCFHGATSPFFHHNDRPFPLVMSIAYQGKVVGEVTIA